MAMGVILLPGRTPEIRELNRLSSETLVALHGPTKSLAEHTGTA